MTFGELVTPFYDDVKSKCGLLNNHTKVSIGLFFFCTAVSDRILSEHPWEDDTFRKWMKNGQGPGAKSLSVIRGYWNREYFKRSILSEINRSALPFLFQRFNIVIPADEQPDPDAFAEAITEQFQALLFNNGEADAIISEVYSKYSNTFSITYYLQNAKEKYSMVKNLLYSSEPKPFYDSFVCNHIEGIHNDPVTLDDVFRLSSYAILVGTGGIGKSMLMQHLFPDVVYKQS